MASVGTPSLLAVWRAKRHFGCAARTHFLNCGSSSRLVSLFFFRYASRIESRNCARMMQPPRQMRAISEERLRADRCVPFVARVLVGALHSLVTMARVGSRRVRQCERNQCRDSRDRNPSPHFVSPHLRFAITLPK